MSTPKRATVPVESYAPLATHYLGRLQRIARLVVRAMNSGDAERVSILYDQGVFAQQCYDHYSRLAACVGDMNEPIPEDPPSTPPPTGEPK